MNKTIMLMVIIIVGAITLTSCNNEKGCSKEGKMCPDGTMVGRNSSNNCEFDPCPATGVTKQYVSQDPEECKTMLFQCEQGKQPFFDDEGCGCEPAQTAIDGGGKRMAIDCPPRRPEACTAEYLPVCGQHADSTTKTYSNGCMACSEQGVVSYTQGACVN